MNIDDSKTRTLTTKAKLGRLLAVLAITLSLVAVSSLSPRDAGASRMTERGMNRACHAAGGHVHYNIYDPDAADGFDMFCYMPSGGTTWCYPTGLLGYLECY